MARPKKLTKAKIAPIVNKFKDLILEYVTSEEEVDSISETLKNSLEDHLLAEDNSESHPEGLTGVVDPRNIGSTGATSEGPGVLVRTKGASEKADYRSGRGM